MDGMIMDTDTREHKGFTFTVETWLDEDAESPRDWDNLVYFYVTSSSYGRTNVDLDELTDDIADPSVGEALHHFLEIYDDDAKIYRAFELWQALNPAERNAWRLFDGSGHGYVQGAYHEYWALVNTRDPWLEVHAAQIVRQEHEVYSTWRYGGVQGVTVSLNGEFVDSCAGFYDNEGIENFVTEAVESHAESLLTEANRAGAGFVGVI
jgi:hypothetical protein